MTTMIYDRLVKFFVMRINRFSMIGVLGESPMDQGAAGHDLLSACGENFIAIGCANKKTHAGECKFA